MEEAKAKYGKICLNPLTPLNFLKRSEMTFPTRKQWYTGTNAELARIRREVYRVANGLKGLGIDKFDRVAFGRAIIILCSNPCMESAWPVQSLCL